MAKKILAIIGAILTIWLIGRVIHFGQFNTQRDTTALKQWYMDTANSRR